MSSKRRTDSGHRFDTGIGQRSVAGARQQREPQRQARCGLEGLSRQTGREGPGWRRRRPKGRCQRRAARPFTAAARHIRLHFHRDIDHFFFMLDGRSRIVINGRENPLRAGSVVWIASGDAHKVYADADGALTFLEYFSRGEHETVFLEQACEWRPNPAGV